MITGVFHTHSHPSKKKRQMLLKAPRMRESQGPGRRGSRGTFTGAGMGVLGLGAWGFMVLGCRASLGFRGLGFRGFGVEGFRV